MKRFLAGVILGLAALAGIGIAQVTTNPGITGVFNPATYTGALRGYIVGTTTNDSAVAGAVGEYIESAITSPTNFPTNTQYGDLTSISLTPGDWDVGALLVTNLNAATMTGSVLGISTTSGNSSTGLVVGTNRMDALPAITTTNSSVSIPSYRMSLAATTTVYLKYEADYAAGTPQARGIIHARRVR